MYIILYIYVFFSISLNFIQYYRILLNITKIVLYSYFDPYLKLFSPYLVSSKQIIHGWMKNSQDGAPQ